MRKGAILKALDYSPTCVHSPEKVFQTQAAQEELKPIVDQMKAEREEVMKQAQQVRSGAKYRDLMDAMDKLTKNIQLLSGEDTEKATMTLTWDDANKNPVQPKGMGTDSA